METAERRLHELPYSLAAGGGETEQGIIDVLFLKDGTWTVVEFKTDRLRDAAELARLLAKKDYRHQVRRYTHAVEQLTGRKPRSILVMLNYSDGIYPEIIEGD